MQSKRYLTAAVRDDAHIGCKTSLPPLSKPNNGCGRTCCGSWTLAACGWRPLLSACAGYWQGQAGAEMTRPRRARSCRCPCHRNSVDHSRTSSCAT